MVTRESERVGDRGEQHYTLVEEGIRLGVVPEGRDRLTSRELWRTLELGATERMGFPPLRAFEDAVEAIEEMGEHGRILKQLGEIGVLTHIVIPATHEMIEQFSASATQTYRARTLSEGLKRNLADRFTNHLRENFTSPEDQQRAILAIRALRNYAIIADDILRQLLWRIQTTGALSFEGLRDMFGRTSLNLQLIPEMERIANELGRAESFIQAAERGIKKTRAPELPEAAMARSQSLLPAMVLLAHEYIEQHGSSEQTVNSVARALVRAYFAHQLHWVKPKEQVLNLGLELQSPKIAFENQVGLKDVCSQFLLEAQLSGLIDLPSERESEEAITREEYEMLGLTDQIFADHQKVIEERKRQLNYIENFLPFIPEKARVVTILGYYNLPHLGYLSLTGATIDILERFSPEGDKKPWIVVISTNKKDLKREKRALKPNEPPAFPLDVRTSLSLVNLSGVINEKVIFTSIENVAGHIDDVPARLEGFRDQLATSEGTLVRACGFDRHGFGRPYMEHMIIGLRGLDLLRIIRNPEMLSEIKERLPRSRLDMILLSGVTGHSSSRVWNTARRFLTTDREHHLHGVSAMVHRKNLEPILEIVGEELSRRGER